MKTHVKMFKDRFAELVKARKKKQTVRPTPKRAGDVPKTGDTISCRRWKGRPRASEQELLLNATIRTCTPVTISQETVVFSGIMELTTDQERDFFAKNDGFKDWEEMRAWFDEQYGLPFTGIAIYWE